MEEIRIGTLISGGGTNMQTVVKACKKRKINGEVVFVGSDNPEAKGLAWAKEKGIPTFSVDYKKVRKSVDEMRDDIPHTMQIIKALKRSFFLHEKFPGDVERQIKYLCGKIVAEQRLLTCMEEYEFDLLVLAGFMQNLTSHFIDVINVDPSKPRIMNIHPALLPSFKGENGYEDTFNYGCKVGGCTVHFVDYGEDTGPIIGQESFLIHPDDKLDEVKKRGLKREWQLYPRCIQLFAEGRLKIVASANGRKIVKIKRK